MIRLGLIRHGHTEWNRAGRIQGRSDIPLDAQAIAHLERLELPVGWQEANLVASPLQRAMQTAQIITGRLPHAQAALIEMDWGDWEGLRGEELRANSKSGFLDIEDWGWSYCPPGGEPPSALRERLTRWLTQLDQDTLAICHIGVMRVLLALATGWNFDGPAPFAVKRDRIFVVEIEDGGVLTMQADPIRLPIRENAK